MRRTESLAISVVMFLLALACVYTLGRLAGAAAFHDLERLEAAAQEAQ